MNNEKKLIEGLDFFEMEGEKYWDYPKTYKKNKKQEIKEYIFSGNFLGSVKKDGHYFRFIKDMSGEMSLQGRARNVNGIFLNKIGHVPHLQDFFNGLPNGTVLLGELHFPDNPGSRHVTSIMGCLEAKGIKRQVENPLHYYIFDIWAYDGKSLLDAAFSTRVQKFLPLLRGAVKVQPQVEVAKFYEKEELWDVLGEALANGEEGMVIVNKQAIVEPGKRTSRKSIKIKKELQNELDVFLTGNYKESTRDYSGTEIEDWPYWVQRRSGERKLGRLYPEYKRGATIEPVTKGFFYGWAGSVEFGAYDIEKEEIIPVGWFSGITEEFKRGIVEDNEAYKLKPCLVTAMEIEDSGKLRHPKFIRFRDDIDWKDCSIDK